MISNRTYIEISGDALRHNLAILSKKLTDGVKVMSVINSNAYGHGLLQAAWALQTATDWFAVDDIEEAKVLRQHGIKNSILVLGAVPEEWYPVARSLRLTLTTPSLLSLRWAVNHGVDAHIKLDTGLGRQGFQSGDDFDKLLSYLGRHKPKFVTGVYTHFAVADNPYEIDFTRSQYQKFQDMAEKIQEQLGRRLIRHTCSTSGVVYKHEFEGDMVRYGIGLYGVLPCRQLSDLMSDIHLIPAMKWFSVVSEIKHISRGNSIGYDRSCVVARDTTIAIIPVGYWHGVPSSMSKGGHVEIRGKQVPIIGAVCMDMIIADVTALKNEVLAGDQVVLIGGNTAVLDIADQIGINHYELLTRINPHIERRLK